VTTPLLHSRVDGSGPRIVLLHPVGLDLTFFEPMVVNLRERYEVVRIDLRGHGVSPTSAENADLADYAADVHAVLTRLPHAPTAVVGFSFGGMLAQVLALAHPTDADALVISACPSTLSNESRLAVAERGALAEREGMAAVVDSTMERWFSEPFRRNGDDAAARRRLLSDDVRGWAQAWRAMAQLNTAPYLASIKTPTLCLAGEADLSSPPRVVEAIATSIPGARFAVISGAPHMLFIERPQAVESTISYFLAGVL
jgi:3-oxoadipate enol-lactonase